MLGFLIRMARLFIAKIMGTATAPIVTLSPLTTISLTAGTAFTRTFTASGGISPYAYAVATGALPAGLSLNSSTGVLSGTPTTAAAFAFGITATDSASHVSSVGAFSGTVVSGGTSDGTPAPTMALTSSPTAYPVTAQATYSPAYHVVGDLLRIAVYPAVAESGGKVLPSGTPSISTTITLVATKATNDANLNAALSGISSGTGFVFVRIEHGNFGDWSVPLQYGTASVPALTSSAAITAYETVPLATTLAFAAPIQGLVLRGVDQGAFELVAAKAGSTFALQFVGGASLTRPAGDFNTDNVFDLSLEATGLNGVVSTTSVTVTLNAVLATAFDFADVSGVAVGAYGVSPSTVTVAGLPAGLSVPASGSAGVRLSKDGGTTWASSVSVQNGDALKAEVQTPGTASITSATVSFGGRSDTFTATNTGYAVPYTLDASYKTSQITLSGTLSEIATTSSSPADERVLTIKGPSTGKSWREIKFTNAGTGGDWLFGFTSHANWSVSPGTAGFAFFLDSYYTNGISAPGFGGPGLAIGDWIGVAIDHDADKIWIYAQGVWWSAGGDPNGTGSGNAGATIAAGADYTLLRMTGAGASATINDGSSAFALAGIKPASFPALKDR